ncbi:type IV toxin-antitoxin system AbiEi family antitoxin [Actinoplanes sp. NPDC049596]|uniref:type IV toxin-antitoxin system AbiEi family antitoxin n=1 Tax=unclassified Actinoplanes TaxID=2626549 RepID=UPI003419D0F9
MQNRTATGSGSTERFLAMARERLGGFGIALEQEPPAADGGADAVVVLSRGSARAGYLVQAKATTLTAVAHRESRTRTYPLLVIGDRISRRSADAFRAANIQFIDALGNAFISFGDVFIDIRGRAERNDQASSLPSGRSAGQPVNLFSRGRAQVIVALLAWPELVGAGRRKIANASGASLGQTQDAMSQLEKAGFLLPSSLGLTRIDELVDYWTAAYPTGLGPRLEVAEFHGDPSLQLKSEHPVYLSGETAAGVDIARPAAMTVYVSSLEPKLAIVNRWSTNPDRVRNIFVRRKFWTSPRPAEEDPAIKTQNAPWPLVYADLMVTGDPRLAEVARTWRADHARPA